MWKNLKENISKSQWLGILLNKKIVERGKIDKKVIKNIEKIFTSARESKLENSYFKFSIPSIVKHEKNLKSFRSIE